MRLGKYHVVVYYVSQTPVCTSARLRDRGRTISILWNVFANLAHVPFFEMNNCSMNRSLYITY